MSIYDIQAECRANLNVYLSDIMGQIPHMEGGRVLDMGCGSGVSSLEIARTTDYLVTSMDIDEKALENFVQRVENDEVHKNINISHGTFDTVIRREETFDIVLAEGLFNIIGFETGLRKASAVLKEGGYLLLHDDQDSMERKGELIEQLSFDICSTLELDEKVWGCAYCACLKKKLEDVRGENLKSDEKIVFEQIRADLRLFHDSPRSFRSIYYLLKKRRK